MTRLGDFFNVLVTNFLAKLAQIICYLLGLFKKIQLSCKNDLAILWGISGNIGQLFIPSFGHTAPDARAKNNLANVHFN